MSAPASVRPWAEEDSPATVLAERIFLVLWLGLCAGYLLGASPASLAGGGAGALVFAVILLARSQRRALRLLILVVHTGPVVRADLPMVGMLTFGDVFLALAAARFLAGMVLGDRLRTGPLGRLTLPLVLFGGIAVVLSPDARAVAPGAIAQIQIALAYFLTLNLVRNEEEAWDLLTWAAFAVLVSAVMHLGAFVQGRTLLLSLESSVEGSQALSVGNERARAAVGSYFKTSFFYGSFMASCAAIMTAAVVGAASARCLSGRGRLLWAAAGLAALTSSLVSGNRTPVLAAGAVSAAWLILLTFRSLRRPSRALSVLSAGLLLAAVIGGGMWLQGRILSPDQKARFQIMFRYAAASSMNERYGMWAGAWSVWDRFPREILIGLGPDVPQRGGSLPEVQRLMGAIGTPSAFSFHNFYLDVLFQNGIFFFLLMVSVLLWTVAALIRRMREDDRPNPIRAGPVPVPPLAGAGHHPGLSAVLLCILLCWMATWMVHATGWSKPVLLLSQVMALAHLTITGFPGPRRIRGER